MRTEPTIDKLTKRQQAFIMAYLSNGWNATKAARTAGYAPPHDIQGSRTLSYVRVKAAIEQELRKLNLSVDQIRARLSEMATAKITDFLNSRGRINWREVSKKGHLVKRLKLGKAPHEIELYDAQNTLVHLAKMAGLFVEKTEVAGLNGGPVQHVFTIACTAAELPKPKKTNAKESNQEQGEAV